MPPSVLKSCAPTQIRGCPTQFSRATSDSNRKMHVQVYVALPRRESADGLLAPKTRPLAHKVDALVHILLHYMREKWGGGDEAQCAAKMVAAANRISNGVENA